MMLSEINANNLSDEKIDEIVFDEVEDCCLSAEYGLVFGNQKLMQQRVEMAVSLYNMGRIKKIVFMGGSGIAWNQENIVIPEALRMKDMAMSLGVLENDILIEDKSMNSVENAINTSQILNEYIGIENINRLVLITSEFHMKRAMLGFRKYIPNAQYILVATRDGIHDKSNWKNSEEGRKIIDFEAKRLIELASRNEIADMQVNFKDITF